MRVTNPPPTNMAPPPKAASASRTCPSAYPEVTKNRPFAQAGSNASPQDYRVPPSRTGDVKPDANGIHVVPRADGSGNDYFTRVGNDLFQVDHFNGADMTWKVTDPRSGTPAFTIGQDASGHWTPTAQADKASSGARDYPPGLRGKLLQAVDKAIGNIKQARENLFRPWSAATSATMQRLHGKEAFTTEGRQKLDNEMKETLRGLEHTRAMKGTDMAIYPFGWDSSGKGPIAGVANERKGVDFSTAYVSKSDIHTLTNLVEHEYSHLYAGTEDHWYLSADLGQRPNFDGYMAPHDFAHSSDNADSIAKTADVLARNA